MSFTTITAQHFFFFNSRIIETQAYLAKKREFLSMLGEFDFEFYLEILK